MQEFNLKLLNELLGKDVETEFHLKDFQPEERQKIIAKIEERVQNVILETALAKMTDAQFAQFQKAVEGEKDPNAIQEKVAGLAKDIDGLDAALKAALLDELDELKKIVNEG